MGLYLSRKPREIAHMKVDTIYRLRFIVTAVLLASAVLDIALRGGLALAQQTRFEPAPIVTSAIVALVLTAVMNKMRRPADSLAKARVPVPVSSAVRREVWKSSQPWLMVQLLMLGKLTSWL